jgi:DNA-binding beta-propeller fold protein YncE
VNFIFSVDIGGGGGSQGNLFGWTFSGGPDLNAGFTPAPGTPIQADTNPLWVTVVPSGAFLYVAAGAAGSGQILGYSISGSGLPLPIGGSPFVTTSNPAQLAVDPSGNFLYAMSGTSPDTAPGAQSGNVSGFLIGTTGLLTPAPGSFVSIASPSGLAISRK